MKKVSIIVPIYKSEKFLDKLIQSVLGQTYTNFELILVDDESPDNSGAICEKYAAEDDRIVVIHKKNEGCSKARNTGLKHVTGEYLTFIDGDDWMEPDCLEYLIGLIEKNGCDMSMSDCLFTTSNHKQNDIDNIRIMTPEQAICCIFYVHTPVGAWNKMYTVDMIKKNNITFAISWFGEGLYFSSMCAQFSNKIAVGHRKVYGYRENNPNSGTTIRKVQDGINALDHSIYVRDQIVIHSKEIDYAANWHIWKNHYILLLYIIGANERAKYEKEYKRAIDGIRKMGNSVFIHSRVNFKQKIIILVTNLFPKVTVRCSLLYKKIKFARDMKKD